MNQFALWLSQTSVSQVIQVNAWVIPTVQSIHIVAIGIVLSSVFMIDLRILGWAGRDQALSETTSRFFPWLSWALCVLLVTGVAMVIGEPVRELMAFSFWFKMCLVAIGTVVAVAFQRSVRRNAPQWESSFVKQRNVKSLAILTLFVWASVVVLGRLIAYDHVWGSWSMAPKL